MSLVDIPRLLDIAELEFGDIVSEAFPGINELRLVLVDSSLVDIWFSLKLTDRYSYHWGSAAPWTGPSIGMTTRPTDVGNPCPRFRGTITTEARTMSCPAT